MYDRSDPRAALATGQASHSAPVRMAPAEYGLFYETAPQETGKGAQSWFTRGQNFLTAYSQVEAGAVMARTGQPDEYVLLLPDAGLGVDIEAAGEQQTVEGPAIVFVPPGDSRITARAAGRLVRLLTTRSGDLVALCPNAGSYAQPRSNIPPLEDWPTPPDGLRIRAYSLDVPKEPGRFGRIWRGTTFMVNMLDPAPGPRDVTKLSPHHHDDFEQGSLVLDGSYTHHIRWPWTTDMTAWREDEHRLCKAPSLTVIPPPAIHTSRAEETGQMVDIFCPPRLDFSAKPGWVLNDADYPVPAAESTAS